jgi:hypothetical protein
MFMEEYDDVITIDKAVGAGKEIVLTSVRAGAWIAMNRVNHVRLRDSSHHCVKNKSRTWLAERQGPKVAYCLRKYMKSYPAFGDDGRFLVS